MTQEEFKAQQRSKEDIELLILELCQRMPYGIKLQKCGEEDTVYQLYSINLQNHEICYWVYQGKALHIADCGKIHRFRIPRYKPYLFPMSSMSEEQLKELGLERDKDIRLLATGLRQIAEGDKSIKGKLITPYAVDWCNKNHFDYRGLIPKGLANDATGLNIYE